MLRSARTAASSAFLGASSSGGSSGSSGALLGSNNAAGQGGGSVVSAAATTGAASSHPGGPSGVGGRPSLSAAVFSGSGANAVVSISDAVYPNLGMHRAAANGNVGMVKYALDNGQPHSSLVNGLFPLHAASSGGSENVVRLLIAYGADVNAPRLATKGATASAGIEGSTPLHFAAANGHLAIVTLLLESGARPAAQDKDGVTAEALAQANGHSACASMIRSYYATYGPNGLSGRVAGPSRPSITASTNTTGPGGSPRSTFDRQPHEPSTSGVAHSPAGSTTTVASSSIRAHGPGLHSQRSLEQMSVNANAAGGRAGLFSSMRNPTLSKVQSIPNLRQSASSSGASGARTPGSQGTSPRSASIVALGHGSDVIPPVPPLPGSLQTAPGNQAVGEFALPERTTRSPSPVTAEDVREMGFASSMTPPVAPPSSASPLSASFFSRESKRRPSLPSIFEKAAHPAAALRAAFYNASIASAPTSGSGSTIGSLNAVPSSKERLEVISADGRGATMSIGPPHSPGRGAVRIAGKRSLSHMLRKATGATTSASSSQAAASSSASTSTATSTLPAESAVPVLGRGNPLVESPSRTPTASLDINSSVSPSPAVIGRASPRPGPGSSDLHGSNVNFGPPEIMNSDARGRSSSNATSESSSTAADNTLPGSWVARARQTVRAPAVATTAPQAHDGSKSSAGMASPRTQSPHPSLGGPTSESASAGFAHHGYRPRKSSNLSSAPPTLSELWADDAERMPTAINVSGTPADSDSLFHDAKEFIGDTSLPISDAGDRNAALDRAGLPDVAQGVRTAPNSLGRGSQKRPPPPFPGGGYDVPHSASTSQAPRPVSPPSTPHAGATTISAILAHGQSSDPSSPALQPRPPQLAHQSSSGSLSAASTSSAPLHVAANNTYARSGLPVPFADTSTQQMSPALTQRRMPSGEDSNSSAYIDVLPSSLAGSNPGRAHRSTSAAQNQARRGSPSAWRGVGMPSVQGAASAADQAMAILRQADSLVGTDGDAGANAPPVSEASMTHTSLAQMLAAYGEALAAERHSTSGSPSRTPGSTYASGGGPSPGPMRRQTSLASLSARQQLPSVWEDAMPPFPASTSASPRLRSTAATKSAPSNVVGMLSESAPPSASAHHTAQADQSDTATVEGRAQIHGRHRARSNEEGSTHSTTRASTVVDKRMKGVPSSKASTSPNKPIRMANMSNDGPPPASAARVPDLPSQPRARTHAPAIDAAASKQADAHRRELLGLSGGGSAGRPPVPSVGQSESQGITMVGAHTPAVAPGLDAPQGRASEDLLRMKRQHSATGGSLGVSAAQKGREGTKTGTEKPAAALGINDASVGTFAGDAVADDLLGGRGAHRHSPSLPLELSVFSPATDSTKAEPRYRSDVEERSSAAGPSAIPSSASEPWSSSAGVGMSRARSRAQGPEKAEEANAATGAPQLAPILVDPGDLLNVWHASASGGASGGVASADAVRPGERARGGTVSSMASSDAPVTPNREPSPSHVAFLSPGGPAAVKVNADGTRMWKEAVNPLGGPQIPTLGGVADGASEAFKPERGTAVAALDVATPIALRPPVPDYDPYESLGAGKLHPTLSHTGSTHSGASGGGGGGGGQPSWRSDYAESVGEQSTTSTGGGSSKSSGPTKKKSFRNLWTGIKKA